MAEIRKALVLGSDNRSFLAVIRSLGRKGVTVHAATWQRNLAAFGSRYIASLHLVEPPRAGGEFDIRWLCSLMERERFDLTIPCDDPWIVLLQPHRKILEQFGLIYLLPEEIQWIVANKHKMNELARCLGVRLPRERLVAPGDDLDQVRREFAPPVVLKPVSSVTAGNTATRHIVRKAFSREEFSALLPRMLAAGEFLVQENFIGTGIGVECLARAGEILFAFQHQRVHEPLHGGGSSYRKGVELTQDLLDASRRIIRALRYTGVAMLEFKRNPATGDWIFIEINARFWGSLPLAVASGADFPWFLFQMLVDGRKQFDPFYKRGLHCRNLSSDVNWMMANLKADKRDPMLATRPMAKVLGELVNIATLKERSDTLTLDDPKPGFLEAWQVVREVATRGPARALIRWSSTTAGRRLQRRRAVARLRRAKAVIFVCLGNVCCSFAARLGERVLGRGMDVSSRGSYLKVGQPFPAEAIAAAISFGVSLDTHASRLMSGEAIRRADVIFILDRQSLIHLLKHHPLALRKIFFLGSFGEEASVEIADPCGLGEGGFAEAYGVIAKCLDALGSALSRTERSQGSAAEA